MQKLLTILTTFFTVFNSVGSEVENYELIFDEKKVIIPFSKTPNSIRINDVCINNLLKCKAWNAFKKPVLRNVKRDTLSNVAAAYCKKIHGGVPMSLRNAKGETISFCAFSDHTIISSWDLYSSFEKKYNKKKRRSKK